MDRSSLLCLDPPLSSSCLLSYLTPDKGHPPYGLGIPRGQTLFCPSLHSPQGSANALNSFSPTSSVPSWIKTGHPGSRWKPCSAPTYSARAKLPALKKQANQALPLFVRQVNSCSVCKAHWDVDSFWRSQPAHRQDHSLMCGRKRLCRHFNLCVVTAHS